MHTPSLPPAFGSRLVALLLVAFSVAAIPRDGAAADLGGVDVHGFASQGYMHSIKNDYFGSTQDGTLDLSEVGINFGVSVTEDLRVGMQLFARRLGNIQTEGVDVDWAYIDYRWADWLGLRVGTIRTPLGLYGATMDIDVARTPILLPQGVYDLTLRIHTGQGASIYGDVDFFSLGSLSYDLWWVQMEASLPSGTLYRGRNTTGGQLRWTTPLTGLRVAATLTRAESEIERELDDDLTDLLHNLNLVDEHFTGQLVLDFPQTRVAILSLEYSAHNVLFAAEYYTFTGDGSSELGRFFNVPDFNYERYYAMVGYRFCPHFEMSSYYSVHYDDAENREGEGIIYWKPHTAWQKDLALTLRFDVNDWWVVKVEGHVFDGTASAVLSGVLEYNYAAEPGPPPVDLKRHWGLFLVKSTLFF